MSMSASPERLQEQNPNIQSQNWLDRWIKGSAPSQRDVFTAYVSLQRKQREDLYEDVGTFVLGLYQLAKGPSGLRQQRLLHDFESKKRDKDAQYVVKVEDLNAQDEDLLELIKTYYPNENVRVEERVQEIKNTLFHQDGSKKTPFELAIIPSNKLKEIKRILEKEYKWQLRFGILPQEIFNAQIGEWMGRLNEADLRIKEGTTPKHLTWKIDNPKPSRREHLVHYLMGIAAYVMTALSAIMTFMAVTSPLIGVILGIGTILALKSAHAFSTYDLGEWLLKDGRWAATKNFLTLERFSFKNTARSLLILASMGILAMMGAQAVFASALTFPILSALHPTLLTATAWLAGAWSFAATMIGLSIPVRFLQGLSFHDNQIAPEEMHSKDLPKVPEDDGIIYQRRLNQILRTQNPESVVTQTQQSAPILVERVQEAHQEAQPDTDAKKKPMNKR